MQQEPIDGKYDSLIVRLWRPSGGEAAGQKTGWCSEVEHIQSGGQWNFFTIGELERFLIDFLHQPDESGVAKEG